MPLRMPPKVQAAYREERRAAAAAPDAATAWRHLERAHILAQPFAVAHVGSHIAMLRQGVRDHDTREIAGQVIRVIVAAPPSLLGRYPTGNTGRARVALRATLPVPEDLASLLATGGQLDPSSRT